MTSVMGVKTDSGIVIAADSNIQYFDDDDKEVYRRNMSKIHTGRFHAMASSGWHDTYFEAFEEYVSGNIPLAQYLAIIAKRCDNRGFNRLIGDVRPTLCGGVAEILARHASVPRKSLFDALRENGGRPSKQAQALAIELHNYLVDHHTHAYDFAIQDGKLREFALLNELRFVRYNLHGGTKPEDTEVVIAIRDPELELYHIDGKGVMKKPKNEDLEYLVSGSGGDHITEYIDNEMWFEDGADVKKGVGKLRAHSLRLNQAIWLAVGAVTYASRRDVYSSEPVHLAVVTSEAVKSYAAEIAASHATWRRIQVGKIARRYTGRKAK